MLTVTDAKANRIVERRADLADLRAACKTHGITQDAIAEAAGVTRPLVVNVFAGRAASKNVVASARGLVEAAVKRHRRVTSKRRRKSEAA